MMRRVRDVLVLSALCLFLICFAYVKLGWNTEGDTTPETETETETEIVALIPTERQEVLELPTDTEEE